MMRDIKGSLIDSGEVVALMEEFGATGADPGRKKTVIILRGIGGIMTVYESVDWVRRKLGFVEVSS